MQLEVWKRIIILNMCVVSTLAIHLNKKNITKSFKMIRNKQDLVFPLSEYSVPIQKAIYLRRDKVNHLISLL